MKQREKKMPILTNEQIDIAVKFWTRMFRVADKRDEFADALRSVLENVDDRADLLSRGIYMEIQVDYDPSVLLIKALSKIGIECIGSFFSAIDLFPCKTRSYLYDDGVVGISIGYRDPIRDNDRETTRCYIGRI
jgi:hypothetical protein